MADNMMRMAGRGSDGTAKPVKTDDSGNISSFLATKDIEVFKNEFTEPNTWLYTDFIDTQGFAKSSAVVRVLSPEVEVYVDFSSNGVNRSIQGSLYKVKPNGAGAIPLHTPTTIDNHMRYVRFRIRHFDTTGRSITFNLRLFNVSTHDNNPNLLIYENSRTKEKETLQGLGGSIKTAGMSMQEYFQSDTSQKKVFSQRMNAFCISNDGDADLRVTIAGNTFTVKAGEVFREGFVPFTEANIISSVPYRAWGLL